MKASAYCALVSLGMMSAGGCNTSTTSPLLPCVNGTGNAATTTADWVYTTNVEAGLYFAAVDPVVPALFTFAQGQAAVTSQASAAATAVAQAAGTNFPNGCATATASQNVVTFNLNNCTGPLGISNLKGTVTATINATGNGQVQTQLAGTNVTSNNAILNLNTSGTTTVGANGLKTLTATSMTTGTGPAGNSIAHGGTYTVVWPTSPNCATINASFVGAGADASTLDASTLDASTLDASTLDASTLDASTLDAAVADAAGVTTTTITNYVTCTGMCAQSGTSTTAAGDQSVTLTFNGSNTAQCSASNGQSGTLSIKCP